MISELKLWDTQIKDGGRWWPSLEVEASSKKMAERFIELMGWDNMRVVGEHKTSKEMTQALPYLSLQMYFQGMVVGG